MKRYTFKSFLMAAVVVTLIGTGFTSCDPADSHDELTGEYAAPTQLNINSASVLDKTKDGNLRTFTVQFGTSEGVTLNMVLVSNQYYLVGTGYTYATSATKNGNYIAGSTINGSQVTSGTFNVAKEGDTYTFALSSLFTEDGKAYRINGGEAIMEFEPDDPIYLTQLLSAGVQADGALSVLMSTGGYTTNFDPATYTTTYSGEGNDLLLIFNASEDGKLHPGTYSPGSGYVAGYEYEASWGDWTWTAYAGSLWYTYADGAQTTSLVDHGDVVVTKEGSVYTITIDQGKEGIYAQYKGAIPDLDPDGAAKTQELTYGGGMNWVAWGGNTIALGFAGPGASIKYENWSWAASGTGVAFNVEFFSSDGTLAEGTYVAAADDAVAAGTYKQSASVLHKVNEDVDTASACDATFVVTKDGDNYKIETVIDGVPYVYNGPISL